jgi:hypothetical protein
VDASVRVPSRASEMMAARLSMSGAKPNWLLRPERVG